MYINLITNITNAQMLKKERIKFPYSIMDEKILDILVEKKFVMSYEKKGKNPKRYLEVVLMYKKGKGAINGTRFLSTPSRRIYKGYEQIKPVRQGKGITVITTSSGIISNQEALTKKIGGQLLFTMW